MARSKAFVQVNREWCNSEEWLAEPFDRVRAWMDIFIQANFADTKIAKRGELLTSERELAERWQWSRSKVRTFLRDLEVDGRIRRTTKETTKRTTKRTTIIVEKYDVYQWLATTKKTTNETTIKPNIDKHSNKQLLNISLNIAERESLLGEFGEERLAKLEADVRSYYEANEERVFPGWAVAIRRFASNQARWGSGGTTNTHRREKSIEELAAEAFAGLED